MGRRPASPWSAAIISVMTGTCASRCGDDREITLRGRVLPIGGLGRRSCQAKVARRHQDRADP
ncbi:MAG: S16 family serine protease [Xanthobacteraceae bacterium]